MTPNYYNYFIPYHPFSRVSSDIRYLPVLNYKACKDMKPGDLIFLYGRDTQGKISRIGKCVVRFPTTRFRKVPRNEMIPVDVTDNKKWMQGTSLMFGRYCGWGEHLVKDFNERFGEKKEEDQGPEYTPEEIYSMFSDFCDRCYPLSSDEKHFAVYDSKGNRVRNYNTPFGIRWHVIDRHLNSVFGQLNEVHVSKDNFFIISKECCGKYTIFKPDCETVIIGDEDRSFYQLRCDDAGNLYYGKDVLRQRHENYHDLYKYITRYGCTTLDGKILIPFEYNSIQTADEEGFIMVQKGNKYGCVDNNNNVLIPIEYRYFYRYFGTNGWPAIVVLNK